MKKIIFALILISLTCLERTVAQGYIVPSGVTYFSLGAAGSQIQVVQNPTNNDFTGFLLKPNGETPPTDYVNTFKYDYFLDEGVRVFLVSSNDAISLQPILGGAWTELSYPSSYVFQNGEPFYVGLYSGYNPWIITNNTSFYTGIYQRPVFGWARLVNNQGTIRLLDSALCIEAAGIYAGTQTIIQPVPEPRTWALATLGLLLLVQRLRRPKD